MGGVGRGLRVDNVNLGVTSGLNVNSALGSLVNSSDNFIGESLLGSNLSLNDGTLI